LLSLHRGVRPGIEDGALAATMPRATIADARGTSCVSRGGNGRAQGVAHSLKDDPAVRLDRGAQQGIVASERRGQRLALPLPELGRALAVGEEERHGASRQVGHWPPRRLSVLARTDIIPIGLAHSDRAGWPRATKALSRTIAQLCVSKTFVLVTVS